MDNTVIIGKSVIIKEGVELHYVTVGDNVKIGKGTTIFGSRDTQVIIGANTYISPNCYFNGSKGLLIGSDITFSYGVQIFSDSGPNAGLLTTIYPIEEKTIIIENGCWICASSILLPGAMMKKNSILGCNSSLKATIPEATVYAGNPAKFIKKICLKGK